MILDFNGMVNKYSLWIEGVVQIGAHIGEEVELLSPYNAIHIEPQPKAFEQLYNKAYKRAYCELISNTNKEVDFHISNFTMCSSVYNTEKSRGQGISFVDVYQMDAITLKTFFKKYGLNSKDYNTLVIDVEGSELDVLEGTNLEHIDYIFVEFNNAYENTVDNLKEFLCSRGFKLVETATIPNEFNYGDLLFIR